MSLGDRLYEQLLQLSHKTPKVPSREAQNELLKLESLLSKIADMGIVENPSPIICGSTPERAVVELRLQNDVQYLTYWYFWSYDIIPGDHADWEPATLVYKDNTLQRVDTRVHDGLVSSTPLIGNTVKLYFHPVGHTPIVKVANRHDVTLVQSNDNLDATRNKWIDACYRKADNSGWQANQPPSLEQTGGPTLDIKNWHWGKHSIFLKL